MMLAVLCGRLSEEITEGLL
uniref:Uncharacterized protein n=1 Tax=Arundo donax TaxID=35708 RepID=A0A0A9AXT7_ARUDO